MINFVGNDKISLANSLIALTLTPLVVMYACY